MLLFRTSIVNILCSLTILLSSFIACDALDIQYIWNMSDLQEEEEMFVNAFCTAYKDQTPESLNTQGLSTAEWLRTYFSKERAVIKAQQEKIYYVSAYHKDKVVGFAAFNQTENEHEVYIRQLCVDPNYWGKGIGEHLVFSIGQQLPKTNKLVLVTRRINTRTRDFYINKCGFTESNYTHERYSPEVYVGFEWHGDIKQKLS